MKKVFAYFKLIFFLVSSFAIYFLWLIGKSFVREKIGWRQFAFRLWANFFVRLANTEIEVIGTPPKSPFLLVSNHLSYFDIAVFRSLMECIFVAKADIAAWPGAGKIIADMGTIFINRENRRDIPRAGQEILNALERGESVVIFPEGTSSQGETVLPFKSSFMEFAATGDLPVYYASISYRTPADETPASLSVCWWGEMDFVGHILEFFQLSKVEAIVTFGEQPIQSKNRKELAKKLHEAVKADFTSVN
jgi:1-acyl-sn-glycerol-3-phosphate acyltransferase